MTVLAIIAGALILAIAWGEHLAHTYGQQVYPGTLTQGFALFIGWFVILIALAATVLLVVVL